MTYILQILGMVSIIAASKIYHFDLCRIRVVSGWIFIWNPSESATWNFNGQE